MGYPGDEGIGPPDSRPERPSRRRPLPVQPAGEGRPPGAERPGYDRPPGYTQPSQGTQPPRNTQPSQGTEPYRSTQPPLAAPPGGGPPPSPRGRSGGQEHNSGASAGQPAQGGQPASRHASTAQDRSAETAPAASTGSRDDVWRRPAGRPEREIQGGVGQGFSAAGNRPRVGGSLWGVGAFRTAGPAGKGPLRGFPPAPGAPDPVYPPGQFSPWNPPAVRSAGPGGRPGPGPWPADASEPGYSLLAVSDPSADMTSTQTWAVLDAAQLDDGWTDPPAGGGPRAAADTDANLAPGGAYATEQPEAVPWPDSPADAHGPDPAGGWTNGPAAVTRPPITRSTRESRRQGRGIRDASDADMPGSGQWPEPDAEATGWSPAAAQTSSRSPSGAERRATGSAVAANDDTATRVSRAAARGRKSRKPPSHSRVWLLPILMALAVAALVTIAYLHFVKGSATGARASPPLRTAGGASSPAAVPSLGPWRHITTRSEDSVPLTLTELFPARFSSGGTTATRTVDQAGTDCLGAVLGAGLQAALHKADCTQVMRASYVTTNQQIMSTIGVLNLVDATSAQRAGQATGAAEFIDQLPAASGPTHNLTKGTGLEEAVYKGHYLILIWAEFTNLRPPTTAAEGAQLKTFSDNLVSGTANISLTSRMVIGKSQSP